MPRDDLIQYRRGTHTQWETANPVLAEGEVGYTTDAPHTLKIGDGWATWTALPVYLSNESTGGGGGGTGPVGPVDPTVYSSDFSPIEWRWAIPDGAYALALQARTKGSDEPWGLVNYPSTVLTTDALNTALEHLYTDGEGGGFRFIRTGDSSQNFELQSNLPDGEWRTVQTFPVEGGGGSSLPLTYANDGPEDTTGGEFFLNDRIKFVVRTPRYGGGAYFDIYARTKIGTPDADWLYLGDFYGTDDGAVTVDLGGDVLVSGKMKTKTLQVQEQAKFMGGLPEVYDINSNPIPIATEQYVAEHGQRVFAGNEYDGTSGIVIKDGTFPFTYGPTPSDVNLINDGGYLTVLHKAVDRNTGEPVAGYSESNPWVDHIYIGPITRTKNGDGTYGAMTGGEISMYVYNRPYTSGFSVNDRDVLLAGIEMSNVADANDLPPGQGKYKMTNYNAVNLPVFTGVQNPGDLGRNHEVYITVPASDPGAYSGFQQYASSNQSPEIFVRTYYEKHEDPDSSDREYVWSPWVQINKAP